MGEWDNKDDFPVEDLATLKKMIRRPKTEDIKSNKINTFLRTAGPERALKMCLCLCRARGRQTFTTDDDLLVFVGDTHIHLFKEWICDNFVKPAPTNDPSKSKDGYFEERQSLWPDFKAFIDHAAKHAHTIFNLGDFYDVWEVQGFFELAYDGLQKIMQRPADLPDPQSEAALEQWERNDRTLNYVPYRLMRVRNKYRELFRKHNNSHSAALRAYFGVTGPLDPNKWANQARAPDAFAILGTIYPKCLATANKWGTPTKPYGSELRFYDRSEVEKAIKSLYTDMEKVLGKMTMIRGNHDTEKPNLYLDRRFGPTSAAQHRNLLKQETSAWTERDDPDLLLVKDQFAGTASCIYFEHGHAFDHFNNDKNYFRHNLLGRVSFYDDAGYHKTRGWIRDEISDPTTWLQGKKHSIGEGAQEGWAEERMQAIFDWRLEHLRLVVMGHTHVVMFQEHTEPASGHHRLSTPLVTLKKRGHEKSYRQTDIRMRQSTIECTRGKIRVTVSMRVWRLLGEDEHVQAQRILLAGQVLPHRFHQSSGSDQDYIVRVKALQDDSAYRIEMASFE